MDIKIYLVRTGMTQSDLARLIGVTPGLVHQWLTGQRPVSPKQCVVIEQVTHGTVTRRDLRQDHALIWPELARAGSSTKRCQDQDHDDSTMI